MQHFTAVKLLSALYTRPVVTMGLMAVTIFNKPVHDLPKYFPKNNRKTKHVDKPHNALLKHSGHNRTSLHEMNIDW